ncbi:MAG: hypothetical protein NC251_11920 [Lachnoclostridium sp.]|nr:hypothetical protein [Lachnospira sp.]MCM1249122.1 hypothetical protein [Lachnoclostridium sp.]MCM1535132.1 hypothetical protein [Clostridium sp.]
MDIKEKISKIVEELTKNEDLKKQFEKEPVKVIEKVIGMDLPDDVVEKVIDGVKAKIAADGISNITGAIKNLF